MTVAAVRVSLVLLELRPLAGHTLTVQWPSAVTSRLIMIIMMMVTITVTGTVIIQVM